MLVDIALTLTGFVLLIGGADRFVAGAASTARILGVPPVIIGLTIVGFATSAPEVLVSISAAINGLTGMAVGNALGSNVANVGLVLAAAAIIKPIRGDLSGTLRRELQVLVAVSVGASLLFADLILSRLDGLLLIGGLVGFFTWVVRSSRGIPASDPIIKEAVRELPAEMSRRRAVTYLLLGFGLLLFGAELLVTGAESLAQRFGLSDLVIGLTIVAIGTSLPELAVSVVSAFRGEPGLAVGNVIGSNVFNLLAVIGVAGLAGPGPVDPGILSFHVPIMLAFTCALLLLAYNPSGEPGIGRGLGCVLLAAFVGYQGLLLGGMI